MSGHAKCGVTGKRRYRDQIAALLTMDVIQRKANRDSPVRAYQCKHCRSWHLTSEKIWKVI